MKIALVSSVYGIAGGGAGLAVQQLANGLQQAGHEVVVVTTGNDRVTISEMRAGMKTIIFRPASFYLVQDKDLRPAWQKIIWQLIDIYNPLTGHKLKEILQAENPDIIHIHKMRGMSGAIWEVAAQVAPGCVIQTCHDFESMSPMGTLDGYVGRLALEGRWPLSLYQSLRSYLSKHINAMTAPSNFALNLIANSGLFPAARRYMVPNTHGITSVGLDSIRSQPAMRSATVRLLFLGRLEIEKGLRELCSAFQLLSTRFPALRLVIAGWGNLETELRTTYGANPNIEFAGKVFEAEKARLLSEADIVVMPSVGLESFGMVAIEAFAYGKPVIAARTGGLAELVSAGETGWLVQPGHVDDLIQAIEMAITHPDDCQRMSIACFEAAKRFTIEEMIHKYERVYFDLKDKTHGKYSATT